MSLAVDASHCQIDQSRKMWLALICFETWTSITYQFPCWCSFIHYVSKYSDRALKHASILECNFSCISCFSLHSPSWDAIWISWLSTG